MITNLYDSSQTRNKNSVDKEDPDVTLLQSFLAQKKFTKLLEDVFTDTREDPTYSSSTLLTLVLSIFFFELGQKINSLRRRILQKFQ